MSISLENWQEKVIDKIIFDSLKEQRRKRRWNIFFRLIFWSFLLFMTYQVFFNKELIGDLSVKHQPHTGIVSVYGPIMPSEPAAAENIINDLNKAFANPQSQAVILQINSPGGSPVQARQVYNEIVRLRQIYPKKPIYSVIEDGGLSGAYLIASAADNIYADETSLVGSIGVVVSGFGMVDTLNKLGMERRVYTAGKNKAMLDPFSPRDKAEEKYLQQQLDIVHKYFIKNVTDGRKDRLDMSNKDELFSGKYWTGEMALTLGLIDDFKSTSQVAREIVNFPILVDYSEESKFLHKIKKFVGRVQADIFSNQFSEILQSEKSFK